jgi:hypothetical protein
MLQGSAPSVVRHRFSAHASSLGARIALSPGASPWSPTTWVAIGVEPARLAAELGWPCEAPEIASSLRASQCWDRGADGSQHSWREAWDWRRGEFADTDTIGEIRLERRKRREEDRADVYVVQRAGGSVLETNSDTVAFIEAHRLSGVPMFECRPTDLVRSSARGHLPIHLARTLYLSTLRAAGPALEGKRWRYVYPAKTAALHVAIQCLGPKLFEGRVAASERPTPLAASSVGLARHRGLKNRLSINIR